MLIQDSGYLWMWGFLPGNEQEENFRRAGNV